jgi:von Willebrand factor type A domain
MVARAPRYGGCALAPPATGIYCERPVGKVVVGCGVVALLAAGAGMYSLAGPVAAAPAAAVTAPRPQAARPPRTDNLVALEMGGRVENSIRVPLDAYVPTTLLDGDPATFLITTATAPDVVLSFLGHDTALVSGVTLTFPPAAPDPIWNKPNAGMWPKQVVVSTSMTSPTAGFRQAAAATLPDTAGEHPVAFRAPVNARYVKLALSTNYGSTLATMLADVGVREGQAPGYVPFLERHADLAALLATGRLPEPTGGAPATPAAAASPGDVCATPPRAAVHPASPESHNVLVVGPDSSRYGPYFYATQAPDSPAVRYFPTARGDGRVDSSIFRRATYWAVPPAAASAAALVPSAGIDTVALAQVCDIQTSVPAGFKQALMAWVAAGHKLIIQDSDKCGPGHVPDYRFLPFPFATSNPGAQGAASALRVVERNFLVSDDPSDPAFFDEESWRLKKNGNSSNDFGDSNAVVKFDPNWCGALVGSNVRREHGFILTYAHYGRGLIIYDGVDSDQSGNVAYRQYVGRQLLLPFDPDPLPCTMRLAPFAVTTTPQLARQAVVPGQQVTYPLAILPVAPGYKGDVALTVATSPDTGDLHASIAPSHVTLGGQDASATLTVTMPARLPDLLHLAVRGSSPDATATLCLAATERHTGTLGVVADPGARPAAPSARNLLIVLDLSGSMNLPLGKSTRIATARQVLHTVLGEIPDDFKVGLRLYGHRYGSKEKQTCTDSELVIPVEPLDRGALLKKVDATRPRGETPLVYSVLQAIGDLKNAGGGGVVLITDGEESCGGDFAAAARTIQASGLDFRLNIVGFTLKNAQARQQLSTLAGTAGGHYYAASDGTALAHAIVAAAISRFPYSVLNAAGKVVAEGEAGDRGQELMAGTYRVVVKAGDDSLTLDRVAVAAGQTVTVRVVRQGNAFVLQR